MVGNASGEVRGQLVVRRYRLGEPIGQGGMGRVWRAVDEMLDRPVAVKEMRIDETDVEDARIRRERSLREARATARIDHPNVVRVYDVAQEGDRLWIVMELVEARSLDRVLADGGPVGRAEAARIGLALAGALRAVHAVGVLHRDIKPGNVLIEPGSGANGGAPVPEGLQGRVVLTDFGIAAIQDASALTVAGTLVGSPDFMAPERIEGRLQGPPSDLWSLGATLCTALDGRSPFARPTTYATLHAVLYEEPRLPPDAGPLAPALAALLHKDPEQRLTLDALEAALTEVAAPAPYVPTLAGITAPEPEDDVPAGWSHRRRGRRAAFLAGTAGAATGVAAVVAAVIVATSGGTAQEAPPSGAAHTPSSVAATSRAPAAAPSAEPSVSGLRDEGPFSWAPPGGWRRTIAPSAIFYHSPDGDAQIAASSAIATGTDPLGEWIGAARAQERGGPKPGYGRVRLERTTFRGHPAAVWEYTYTDSRTGRPWQGRQLRFVTDGKAYEIDVWYDTSARAGALRVYDRLTASFEPH